VNTTRWNISREEAIAEHGMVAAKNPLAVEAGLRVLKDGGNAVDAAITTALTMGVVDPALNGIGGGGFMLYHQASTGENFAIDYFMAAPQAATPDMYEIVEAGKTDVLGFRGVKNDENISGYRSIGVPGMVAGATLALENFGTLSLKQALQPAIHFAEKGTPVTWYQMLITGQFMNLIVQSPPTANVFLKNGTLLFNSGPDGPPERVVQTDLAATLRRIAEAGADEFYCGETARAIVRDLQAHGNLIGEADLANYQARLVKPRIARFRDDYQFAYAPATGGGTLVETFNLLEGFDFSRLEPLGADALHLFIEAARIAYADRWQHLADETQVDVPWQVLESKEYAAQRRLSIDRKQAAAKVEPWENSSFGRGGAEVGGGCTTHLSVIDKDRNMVAITQTINGPWGSGVLVPGTGILFNNAMVLFDPIPGRANSIQADKRPLSSMTPMLVFKNGKPFMSAGALGGRQIIGTVMRVLHNVLEFGMGIQQACATLSFDASAAKVVVDAEIDATTLERLREMGHPLDVREKSFMPRLFASPTGILVDPHSGQLHGGADPYHPGAATGY
jgi:gamma-glutamyltranspeptidase/glutathione hydrolase